MIYSVISILAPSKNLNPITGAIGYKIGLSFIPGLIVIRAFVTVGLATIDLRRVVKDTLEGQVQSSRGPKLRPPNMEGMNKFSSAEV